MNNKSAPPQPSPPSPLGRALRPLIRRYLASRFVPLPSMLQLEISSCCNLRCTMCAKTLGYIGTVPDKVMEWEIFERVRPILPSLEYVDLSGVWGEAFLTPGLYLKMLASLKEFGIFVRTISNGTLITAEIAREVVRLGLDVLSISVDAARPETYRVVRKGGELASLMAGAGFIRDEKKRQGKGVPRVEFMALGMRDTIAELPEVVAMAAGLGVSRVALQQMTEYPGTERQSLAWRDRELGKQWAEKARAVARDRGVEFSLVPPDQFEAPQEKEVFKEAAGRIRPSLLKDCFLPWKMAVVTTAGDVIPCCAMFKSMGNLKEKNFVEIWRGEAFTELRRKLLGDPPPGTCIVCAARGWRESDPAIELREARGLLALPVRRAFRRNAVLRKLKPHLKKLLKSKTF